MEGGDRVGQAVVLVADRGGIAELACECGALCQGVFELVLGVPVSAEDSRVRSTRCIELALV